jgi:hypothetical protein
MQEQKYESFSSEAERVHGRQGMYDIWNEGEKLQSEQQRQKKHGGVSPLVLIVIVIVVLFVVFLLFGMVAFVAVAHSAHGAIQSVPGRAVPIQNP